MAKEVIRFKGLSLHKDEQSAEHGELALCANVELHDGALRPSVLRGSDVENELKIGGNVATLKYVHETPSFRHFIGQIDHKLYWFNADGTADTEHSLIHDFISADIISLQSVGNTMIVLAMSGVHYVLWKDQSYKYLGTQIPFVDIKFRPSDNNKAAYDTSTIQPSILVSYTAWRTMDVDPDDPDVVQIPEGSRTMYINDNYKGVFTDSIWALVNMANHKISEDGHFYAPFIVRYCYRLYDGSMVMHSAPVYMNVSSPKTYRVYYHNAYIGQGDTPHLDDNEVDIDDGGTSFTIPSETALLYYLPNNVDIMYSIANDANLANLKENWSDIVKSIDIFVSPMMAREKTGERIETANPDTDSLGMRNDALANLKTSRVDLYHEPDEFGYPCYAFDFPKQTDQEYLQRLKDNSTFFKVKSYQIETDTIHTGGEYQKMELSKEVVLTLTSQEQMKDDYRSHNQLFPIDSESGMYVYNHRVNLYGMQERLFDGFDLRTMLNELKTGSDIPAPHTEQIGILSVVVELTTETGVKYVFNPYYSDYVVREYSLCNALLFYPDSRASRMIICFDDGTMMPLKMEPCNFLNGAMATDLFFRPALPEHTTATEQFSRNAVFPMPNKILTSEVDDPYYFPVEGRNSVGNGTVRGVAAVTRALSQGQVGSHDLQVFSTDGIWVLKVSETGTYSSQHNISREVCSNPKSICQLDQSVVFATERSLIKYRESDLSMLSDVLDGPIPDWSTLLPSLASAFPADGTEAQQLINKLLNFGTPAVELFNKGSIFYDYASLRVVVLPQPNANGIIEDGVALAFSLRDEAWSTMAIPEIMSVVPGYPSPFVQLADGKVTILDKPYDYNDAEATIVPGLIITRTLTFSDTMDVIKGYTQYADSAQAPMLYIFGSNDQRSWQALGTSSRWFYNYLPGRSFRFFRVAVYMKMLPSEEYQQLEVEVINKYAKL